MSLCPISNFISVWGMAWISHNCTKRWPKLPPLITRTLSSGVNTFMTVASMEAVPEPVMKATLDCAGALVNLSIRSSFSFIVAENSAVLK